MAQRRLESLIKRVKEAPDELEVDHIKDVRMAEQGILHRPRNIKKSIQEIKYEELAAYVRNDERFSYKECRHFQAAKSSDPDKCFCGEFKKGHDQTVSQYCEGAWNASTHVTVMNPTNAFGRIEFVNPNGLSKFAEYIRISDTDQYDDVLELLLKYWEFDVPELPSLCISVIGGAKNFNLTGPKRDAFYQGLIKAAQTTNAWIITSGLNLGITKVVGEALKEGQRYQYDKKQAAQKLRCLGIAPWGYVLHREKLLNPINAKRDWEKAKPYEVCDAARGQPVSLNENHTHYLLVDDGKRRSYGGSKSAEFRARLERKIARPLVPIDGGDDGLGVPVVLIVVEGGHDVFIDCLNSIRESVPVVICHNTGRAADVLAFAAIHTNNVRAEVDNTMKQLHDLLEKVYESGMKEEDKMKKMDEAKKMILEIIKDKSLITVFDMGKPRADKFDSAILGALLKRKDDDNSGSKKELDLALMWNRDDLAERIITDNKLEISDLFECMMRSIMDDKVKFVRLFLQNGVNMSEFLTLRRLTCLYNDTPKSEHFQRALSNFMSIHKNKDSLLGLCVVAKLLRKLVGHYTNVELDEANLDTLLKEPYNELFLWSILHCRHEMAKFMWQNCQSSIQMALVGSKLYAAMLDAVPDYDTETQSLLQQNKNECELWAVGVLEECHIIDQENALFLVERHHPMWGDMTSLDLAASAENMKFLSSIVCQNSLDFKWKRGVNMDIWFHCLSVFLPTLLFWPEMVKFTGEATASEKVRRFYAAPKTKYIITVMSYLFFLIFYSYFVLFELYENAIGGVEIAIFVYIASLLADELREIILSRAETLWEKVLDWWNFSHWNRLDTLTIMTGITAAFLRIRFTDTFLQARTLYVIVAILIYSRLFRFYSAHARLGPKLVMIGRMVYELLTFITVLFLPLLTYGLVSQALLYPDQEFSGEVIQNVFFYPYWVIFDAQGGLDRADVNTSACNATTNLLSDGSPCPEYNFVVVLLYAFTLIITSILLLNLLIAVFSNVFQEVQGMAIEIWQYKMFFLVSEFSRRTYLPIPLSLLEDFIQIFVELIRKCQKTESQDMYFSKTSETIRELLSFECNCRNTFVRRGLKLQEETVDGLLMNARKQLRMLRTIVSKCYEIVLSEPLHHLPQPTVQSNDDELQQQQLPETANTSEPNCVEIPDHSGMLNSFDEDQVPNAFIDGYWKIQQTQDAVLRTLDQRIGSMEARFSKIHGVVSRYASKAEDAPQRGNMEKELRKMERRLAQLELVWNDSLQNMEMLLHSYIEAKRKKTKRSRSGSRNKPHRKRNPHV